MYVQKDVTQVKRDISRCVGSAVYLESGKGKQRASMRKGIIERAYPSIFTIQLCDGQENGRVVSYSYTDVLTKAVEITMANEL